MSNIDPYIPRFLEFKNGYDVDQKHDLLWGYFSSICNILRLPPPLLTPPACYDGNSTYDHNIKIVEKLIANIPGASDALYEFVLDMIALPNPNIFLAAVKTLKQIS